MFLNSQLSWDVIIHPENMDSEGLMLQLSILDKLMDKFTTKKLTKDQGYLLALTTINRIEQGKIRHHTGELVCRVSFSCITYKMFPGEVLEGVVHKIQKHGVFLRCGPADKLYLSHRKMGGYRLVPSDVIFINDNSEKIELGTVIRFMVVAYECDEAEKDVKAIVSIEGDFLGPVS